MSEITNEMREAAKEEMAYGILTDVSLGIPQYVPTKKLLWMLGRRNDKPAAWVKLLDMWEAIGQDRGSLYGTYWGDKLLLTNQNVEPLTSTWARE